MRDVFALDARFIFSYAYFPAFQKIVPIIQKHQATRLKARPV
jgi:hypothetical protein